MYTNTSGVISWDVRLQSVGGYLALCFLHKFNNDMPFIPFQVREINFDMLCRFFYIYLDTTSGFTL